MNEDRWISVEAKLPPVGGAVQIRYGERGNRTLFIAWRITGNSWDSCYVAPGGATRTVKVLAPTHWRELPE